MTQCVYDFKSQFIDFIDSHNNKNVIGIRKTTQAEKTKISFGKVLHVKQHIDTDQTITLFVIFYRSKETPTKLSIGSKHLLEIELTNDNFGSGKMYTCFYYPENEKYRNQIESHQGVKDWFHKIHSINIDINSNTNEKIGCQYVENSKKRQFSTIKAIEDIEESKEKDDKIKKSKVDETDKKRDEDEQKSLKNDVYKRLKYLKEQNDTLQKLIDENSKFKNENKYPIHSCIDEENDVPSKNAIERARYGFLPIEDNDILNGLTEKESNMYISPLQRTAVVFKKNDTNTRAMCCLYRSITCKCKSKQQIGVKNEEDCVEQKFVSDFADYVHASIFGSFELRKKSSTDVIHDLKRRGLCGSCMHYFNKNDHKRVKEYINYHARTQNCTICKTQSPMCYKNEGVGEVAVCNSCIKMDCKNLIVRSLNILTHIFPKLGITIKQEESIRFSKQEKVSVDYVSRFKSENKVNSGIIIIECDEQQHAGYNQQKERKKFDLQSGCLIAQQIKESGKREEDDHNVKCMFIRFNPDSCYKIKLNGKRQESLNISLSSRIMIMRQWIIWFMIHINEMRYFTTLYLFYDENKPLYPVQMESTVNVHQAPAPYILGADWMYCTEISETKTDRQKLNDKMLSNIIKNRVNLKDVFMSNCWKKDNQQDPKDYPDTISSLIIKLLE
jgi:hypothetical protein